MFCRELKVRRSQVFLAVFFSLFLLLWMPSADSQSPGKPAPTTSQTTANLLDINTATAAELKALPGVGDAYSQRIIAGRPYTAKNQLVQRGILPQATYDKISARIIAHRPK